MRRRREVYGEITEKLCETEKMEEMKDDTIKEKWEKIKKIVHKAMIRKKIGKKIKVKLEDRDWWDRNCTKKEKDTKDIQEMAEKK